VNLKALGVALLLTAIVGSLFVTPVAEAAPPQPHTFHGVASGAGITVGTRITAFVDGVDYSNVSTVFGANNYDVDVYGNWFTAQFQPNTPEIKEGADIGDPIMFVAGDMTTTGRVFTAQRSWYVPSGADYELLDINLAPSQPSLIKIARIISRPNDPWPDYVYLCNPTPSSVDLTPYYLQKTTTTPNGPRHPLTGALPLMLPPGGLSYVNLTSWDVGGTELINTGDNLKLVWDNPGGTGFGGSDIIIDRVEYNQTGGPGTLNTEPQNTLMIDAPAPGLGQEIRRDPVSCGDTNQGPDFTVFTPATPRPGANTAPTVQVTAPNGGEDWTGNTNHNIVWDMNDAEDTNLDYAINLDLNSGADGFPISVFSGNRAEGTALTYSWLVGLYDTTRARIRVCVFDSASFSACDASDADFTIDSTGPTLDNTNPAGGATGVDVNTDVILTFNEGMSTVETNGAISFNPVAAFTVTWNGPTNTIATVNPTGALQGNRLYTVTIACTAQDDSDAGNNLQACPRSFTFTTAGGAIAPTVDLTAPDGGEDWSGGSTHAIDWTMSDSDTPGNLQVTLEYSTNGLAGPWTLIQTVSRAQGANTFAWGVPCVNSNAARVRATASDGALQTTDNSSANFRIDCTAPTIISRTPSAGANEVPLARDIVIVFSETMNQVPTESAFSLFPGPGGIIFQWGQTSVPDDTLTVFHNLLTACTSYTAMVSTAARDISSPGIALAADDTWTFTTVCPPTVTVTSPAGGERWTGGVQQTVVFTAADVPATSLRAYWINLSTTGVGGPFSTNVVTSGATSLGTISANFVLPCPDSNDAAFRVVAQDPTGQDGIAVSGSFVIDCTAPSVVSSNPLNGATNVGLTGALTVTFSEAMDATTTQPAITLNGPTGAISGLTFTWTSADTVAVGHPKLRANTQYTLAVGTSARDASTPGNTLDPAYSAVFTTTTQTGLTASIDGPSASTVGTTETYTSTSTPVSEISGYQWTVTDPTGAVVGTGQGTTIGVPFTRAGDWHVTLEVRDDAGNTATATVTVTVTERGGTDFLSQYWWLLLILILAVVGALLFVLLGKRRKKEEHLPEAMPPERVETIPPAAPARAPVAPARPAAPPPAPAAPAAAPGARPATKDCPTCGTILDAKDTECFMCGAKV